MTQWYILQVYSGNEKKIEKELLAQVEKKGLSENITKILIPSEEVIEALRSKKDFPSEIVQEHVNWALLEQKRKLLNE